MRGMTSAATRVPPTYADCNRLWVDSRVRAQAQRRVEAPVLLRLGGPVRDAGGGPGRALEMGPGRRGTGLRLALGTFRAARVDAVELHPESVRVCRAAVADLGDRVRVEQGDAAAVPAADGAYDAVFCWHVLHHARDWRALVREAARVLRPGGRLYVADMAAKLVDSRALRAVSLHPADGDRPTAEGIERAARDAGLAPVGRREHAAGVWVGLVAQRPAT